MNALVPAGSAVKRAAASTVRFLANPLCWGSVVATVSLWLVTQIYFWDCAVMVGLAVTIGRPLERRALRRRSECATSLSGRTKSRQLRHRTRAHWNRVMKDVNLTKSQGMAVVPLPLGPIKMVEHGITAEAFIGKISATTDMLRSKKMQIESGIGAVGSRVKQGNPGWASITLFHTDPLAQIVRVSDLPAPTRPGYVVTGVDEDGAGVERELRLPSLTVGALGAGKSSETWTLFYQLLSGGIPFRARVLDTKGTEFVDIADGCYVYQVAASKWPGLLRQVIMDLSERQDALAQDSIRTLTEYTWAHPLDITLVDEMLQLEGCANVSISWVNREGDDETMKSKDALPNALMSQGRSAGHTFVGLAQIAHKAVLGPSVMDLFGYRTLLRVGSKEEVNMVMNMPGAHEMYPAHLLSQEDRYAGIGYVDTRTSRGVVRYRAALLSADERKWMVREMSGLKDLTSQGKSPW